MKHDAVEEAYRRYNTEIYLYALALCGNPADAEELAAEAFFRAIVSARDDTPAIKYWLLRVCRNLWLDNLKKRRFRDDTPLEALQIPVEDSALSRLIQNEEHRRLWRCCMSLPANTRELLIMYYFMDYDIRQISRATGRTPGAVKTALSRARVRLKALLEAEESNELS